MLIFWGGLVLVQVLGRALKEATQLIRACRKNVSCITEVYTIESKKKLTFLLLLNFALLSLLPLSEMDMEVKKYQKTREGFIVRLSRGKERSRVKKCFEFMSIVLWFFVGLALLIVLGLSQDPMKLKHNASAPQHPNWFPYLDLDSDGLVQELQVGRV